MSLARASRLGHRVHGTLSLRPPAHGEGPGLPGRGATAVVQRNHKERLKRINQQRIQSYTREGRQRLRTFKGLDLFRAYLDTDRLADASFVLGAVGDGFSLASVTQPLRILHESTATASNERLQRGITEMIEKTVGIGGAYEQILSQDFASWRLGRISELEGLAGELRVAAQFAGTDTEVAGLGEIYTLNEGGTQEVDLTVESGGITYFVEVAATASKLREKISKGLKGDYPQLGQYQRLMGERKGTQVAYASPDLTPDQLSKEFIDKLKQAKVSIVLRGKIYSPDDAASLVEERPLTGPDLQGTKREVSKLRPGKAESRRREKKKRQRRELRGPRLRDKGGGTTGKELAAEAIEAYEREGGGTFDEEPESDDGWGELEEQVWEALGYWNSFPEDELDSSLLSDGVGPVLELFEVWSSAYPEDYPEDIATRIEQFQEGNGLTVLADYRASRVESLFYSA